MLNDNKRDPLPEEFESIDEFVEFWDKHSTADYPEAFIDAEFDPRQRFWLQPPSDIRIALNQQARERDVSVEELAAELLREQLALPQPVAA